MTAPNPTAGELMMRPEPDPGDPVLRLDGLRVLARRAGADPIPLVRDATLDIGRGELVCLVGESGSGKSVSALAMLDLLGHEEIVREGSVRFHGEELLGRSAERVRTLRGRELAMIFQEPMNSLDPVQRIERQLIEALRRRERLGARGERERIVELLGMVGISDPQRCLRQYPHQLSGGMCQRVMIAMALACRPEVLIADEPTTALDVTIQAQILALINRLRAETNTAVLLITHDMGIAAQVADRVAVMYAGRVVEQGTPQELFAAPRHPYTAGLLACIPPLRGDRPHLLPAIAGSVPDPSALPTGCAFHPRCPIAVDKCAEHDPPLDSSAGRAVACWRVDEIQEVRP